MEEVLLFVVCVHLALCPPYCSSRQLRNLFVTVLMHCDVGDAASLFEKYWRYMTDDIVCMIRNALGKQSYIVLDVLLRSRLLKDLGVLFSENGGSITAYNLPPIVSASGSLFTNRLLFEETCYNTEALAAEWGRMHMKLNSDQMVVYDKVIDAVSGRVPGCFFCFWPWGYRENLFVEDYYC